MSRHHLTKPPKLLCIIRNVFGQLLPIYTSPFSVFSPALSSVSTHVHAVLCDSFVPSCQSHFICVLPRHFSALLLSSKDHWSLNQHLIMMYGRVVQCDNSVCGNTLFQRRIINVSISSNMHRCVGNLLTVTLQFFRKYIINS